MASINDDFYENLAGFTDFDAFSQIGRYTPLPSDWLVVITDVVDSTRAIQDGRYKDINALGVASIVAVLNAAKPLNIPYIFGGDGATFCIPPSQQEPVASALKAARDMAAGQFGLALRIGMVPMQVLEASGHTVRVSKYRPYATYQQAMFAGSGIAYAEALVKGQSPNNPFLVPESELHTEGDFSGFECRWNEIASPHEEIITLLVQCLETEEASEQAVYQAISGHITQIYGNEGRHHPLRENRLALSLSPRNWSAEIKIRTAGLSGWQRWLYAVKLPFRVLLGRLFMGLRLKTRDGNWGRYKRMLVANTDYRKFDDVLRMVISGTAAQRQQLREVLGQLHQDGKIAFGLHAAPTALITCIISDYGNHHVHFLDGANGGYALAAQEMKNQKRHLAGKQTVA